MKKNYIEHGIANNNPGTKEEKMVNQNKITKNKNHNMLDENSEEKTEELGGESSLSSNKNRKKIFLLIGVIASFLILAGIAILIPPQMKASEISKSLEIGEKYLEEGKYEEAILAFDKVIAIDTKNVTAYEGKGASYSGLDNYTEAEAQLENAKSIDFTDNGKVLMADVYVNTDRKDLGLALVDEVVNTQPEATKTIILITDVYSQINENTKTIELLEKQIANTKDKKELTKLYDALIPVCVKVGKSDAEIKTLIDNATSSIGEYTNAFYQNYAYYAPIIKEYRELEANNFSYETTKNLHNVNSEARTAKIKLFYMLEDISGDSVPELVISGRYPSSTSSENNIFDIYRLIGNKPERIFDISSMGNRCQYTLCENNIINLDASSGADHTTDTIYKLDGTTTTTIHYIKYDAPNFYLTDANNANRLIDRAEANSLIDSFNPKTDINWISLN